MEAILGLVILVADIYAIVKIIQSGATTLQKIIWVLVVAILPVIGLIIWYFAGPK
ncbi:PLDc N-terminal domain-containing protein [Fluviibacterium sp. DFM31]|uniref:PLDc N-terminal domain-containing protein n=1 Tax=Meridianimarinicoccus marinus TaxID=3231483 RepID=A0ABV3L243_9RHOB